MIYGIVYTNNNNEKKLRNTANCLANGNMVRTEQRKVNYRAIRVYTFHC